MILKIRSLVNLVVFKANYLPNIENLSIIVTAIKFRRDDSDVATSIAPPKTDKKHGKEGKGSKNNTSSPHKTTNRNRNDVKNESKSLPKSTVREGEKDATPPKNVVREDATPPKSIVREDGYAVKDKKEEKDDDPNNGSRMEENSCGSATLKEQTLVDRKESPTDTNLPSTDTNEKESFTGDNTNLPPPDTNEKESFTGDNESFTSDNQSDNTKDNPTNPNGNRNASRKGVNDHPSNKNGGEKVSGENKGVNHTSNVGYSSFRGGTFNKHGGTPIEAPDTIENEKDNNLSPSIDNGDGNDDSNDDTSNVNLHTISFHTISTPWLPETVNRELERWNWYTQKGMLAVIFGYFLHTYEVQNELVVNAFPIVRRQFHPKLLQNPQKSWPESFLYCMSPSFDFLNDWLKSLTLIWEYVFDRSIRDIINQGPAGDAIQSVCSYYFSPLLPFVRPVTYIYMLMQVQYDQTQAYVRAARYVKPVVTEEKTGAAFLEEGASLESVAAHQKDEVVKRLEKIEEDLIKRQNAVVSKQEQAEDKSRLNAIEENKEVKKFVEDRIESDENLARKRNQDGGATGTENQANKETKNYAFDLRKNARKANNEMLSIDSRATDIANRVEGIRDISLSALAAILSFFVTCDRFIVRGFGGIVDSPSGGSDGGDQGESITDASIAYIESETNTCFLKVYCFITLCIRKAFESIIGGIYDVTVQVGGKSAIQVGQKKHTSAGNAVSGQISFTQRRKKSESNDGDSGSDNGNGYDNSGNETLCGLWLAQILYDVPDLLMGYYYGGETKPWFPHCKHITYQFFWALFVFIMLCTIIRSCVDCIFCQCLITAQVENYGDKIKENDLGRHTLGRKLQNLYLVGCCSQFIAPNDLLPAMGYESRKLGNLNWFRKNFCLFGRDKVLVDSVTDNEAPIPDSENGNGTVDPYENWWIYNIIHNYLCCCFTKISGCSKCIKKATLNLLYMDPSGKPNDEEEEEYIYYGVPPPESSVASASSTPPTV